MRILFRRNLCDIPRRFHFMRGAIFIVFWLLSLVTAWGVDLAGPPTVAVTSSNAVVEWQTAAPSGTHAKISPPSARVSVPDKSVGVQHRVVVSSMQPGVKYSVIVGSAHVWLATNTFTFTGSGQAEIQPAAPSAPSTSKLTPPPTRKIWGNPATLPDHFARHGADFHAKNADDYARMSWDFLQRAKAEGLPAKVDDEGVLRVFDPDTGAFAAYNRNGTTKTFFKPGSPDYFARQPGKSVNLKTWN
jgi:hypothetical protein